MIYLSLIPREKFLTTKLLLTIYVFHLLQVFAVFYYGLIIITIINLFISTVPSVRNPMKKHIFIRADDDDHVFPRHYTDTLSKDTTIYRMLTTEPPDFISITDIFCLMFFTAEFVFRLIVCPSIIERVHSWYTLVDILYLVPSWARLIVDVTHPFYWQKGFTEATLMVFMDAMLVSRVFRIFRLSRHYRGMRVLLLAVKASVGELTLLIVFVMLTLIVYSSLIYCAEQYEESGNFESIFKGLWWSLITLTTVGYGDTYPTGTVGRIIACFCALTGLLIIGMVIPIIAGNFHLYYGFRHAGCEDFGLFKPEFVPSELENPAPNLNNGPLDRRLSIIASETTLKSDISRRHLTHKLINETTPDSPPSHSFTGRASIVAPAPLDENQSSRRNRRNLLV